MERRDLINKAKVKEMAEILSGYHPEQMVEYKVLPLFSKKQILELYIDGTFDNENRISYGGFIAVVDDNEIARGWTKVEAAALTTSDNIAGEVAGFQEGILYARHNGFKQIKVYHDYIGLYMWITKTEKPWKKSSNVAKHYVNWYNTYCIGLSIEFIWVKSHSGVKWNEAVDQYVTEVRIENKF